MEKRYCQTNSERNRTKALISIKNNNPGSVSVAPVVMQIWDILLITNALLDLCNSIIFRSEQLYRNLNTSINRSKIRFLYTEIIHGERELKCKLIYNIKENDQYQNDSVELPPLNNNNLINNLLLKEIKPTLFLRQSLPITDSIPHATNTNQFHIYYSYIYSY